MFDRDVDNGIVTEMMEQIIVEVFLFEFKQQYVGGDPAELRGCILKSTTKSITRNAVKRKRLF